jgi:hypothetical protein
MWGYACAESADRILYPAFQEVIARAAKKVFAQLPHKIIDPNTNVLEMNAYRNFVLCLSPEKRGQFERVLEQRGYAHPSRLPDCLSHEWCIIGVLRERDLPARDSARMTGGQTTLASVALAYAQRADDDGECGLVWGRWCGGRVPCGSARYMPDVSEMVGPQAVQRFRESQAHYEEVAETILEQNTRADEWAAKYHKQVQMHLKGQSQQRLLTRRAYTASILDASGFKVCGPTILCAAALVACLVESPSAYY